jgi:dUTP pyrophosphatase
MKLQIKKLNNNAKTPIYGSEYAAGMDLFSSNEEPIIIEPHTRKIIPTGLSISYDDPNYYMRIAPRSGLSVKNSIDVGAGVIDYDYRGEIKIVLINNHKSDVFHVNKHMKIAQMIPTMSLSTKNVIFEEVNELEDTHRGEGGFGSSGI